MGVTAIKRVFNLSPYSVRFVNNENADKPGNKGLLGPGSEVDIDVWIPWCDRVEDLDRKTITVRVDDGNIGIYSIFQRADDLDGDFVRLVDRSVPGNFGDFDGRRRIGGDSSVNGDRELIVDLDGRLFLQRA